MDLRDSTLDVRAQAEAGAWLQLLHPATGVPLGEDEGQPCRIQVLGADSAKYEEAVARTVARRQRGGTLPKKNVSEDDLLREANAAKIYQAEEIAAVTIGWENIEWEGTTLEHSRDAAIMIYTECQWIREQCIAFFSERLNFLGKERKPSSSGLDKQAGPTQDLPAELEVIAS